MKTEMRDSMPKWFLALLIGLHPCVVLIGCSSSGTAPAPAACGACRGEMVGREGCGEGADIECEHGYEHAGEDCLDAFAYWMNEFYVPPADPTNAEDVELAQIAAADQAELKVCSALNGDADVTYLDLGGNELTIKCDCFKCGQTECEAFIEDYWVWCGNGKGPECVTVEVAPYPVTIRSEYEASLSGGDVCKYKTELVKHVPCGMLTGLSNLCACLGGEDNCEVDLGTKFDIPGEYDRKCPSGPSSL